MDAEISQPILKEAEITQLPEPPTKPKATAPLRMTDPYAEAFLDHDMTKVLRKVDWIGRLNTFKGGKITEDKAQAPGKPIESASQDKQTWLFENQEIIEIHYGLLSGISG